MKPQLITVVIVIVTLFIIIVNILIIIVNPQHACITATCMHNSNIFSFSPLCLSVCLSLRSILSLGHIKKFTCLSSEKKFF